MKTKRFKWLVLFVVVVMLLSTILVSANSTEPQANCYQKTVTRFYRNTTEMPDSIPFVENNYGGYLYYISHYFDNYGVYATYQGVICYGQTPY